MLSKNAETKSSLLAPGMPGLQQPHLSLVDLDPFLSMLHDLSSLGAAMRRIMTVSLTNEKVLFIHIYNNFVRVK